ncbi:MAG: hypothetical protein ACREQL_02125, partial [Candidatus Binatia bacterium]
MGTTGVRAAACRGRATVDLAIVAGAVVAVVACLLVRGGVWEHVGGGDLHGTYVPKYEAAAHAILVEHRLPLWNPYEFCGLPLLGVGHGAVLYPPVWLAFGALPRWAALQAFYAFHAGLLSWGLLVYLRRHGIGVLPAGLASLVAVAGLFAGPSLAGYDHPSFLASVAWLPWMLVTAERAAEEGMRPFGGWLALAAGAQWLCGYPDFPFVTAVLVPLVVLVGTRAPRLRALVVVGAGLGLGAALAAVQILPLAEAVRESPRAVAADGYAPVRAWLAVSSARALARDLVVRQGIAALVLGLLALIRPRRSVWAWAAALAWALFALNPPFVWLYRLPPFSHVRFPLGWPGIAPLFLGCLAAAGLDLGRRAGGRAGLAVTALAAGAAIQSLGVIAGVPARMPHRPPDFADIERRVAQLRPLVNASGGARFVSATELAGGAPLRYGLATPSGYEPSLPPG